MDSLVPDIATTGPRPRQLWSRYALLLGAASLVVALDQLTKAIVRSSLENGRVVELLGGGIRLDYTRNTGAAFGLYQAGDVFFALVAALVSAGIILYYRRVASGILPLRLGLGLVLGGAIGNLIDRLRFGYVIDFIDLRWWPVFNIADSCIVVGVLLLLLASLHQTPISPPRAGAPA